MDIKWQRSGMDLKILNTIFFDYSNPGYILNEAFMDPIQQWCWEYIPSVKRMSFDTFRFEREEDMSAFLLRWS